MNFFRQLFSRLSIDKFKDATEFEWMAKHAVHSYKIKLDNLEKLTTFYNSDVQICVLRSKKSFYVLDYAKRKKYALKDHEIHTDLDDFLILNDGNVSIICRVEMKIMNLIKKEIGVG